MGRLLYGIASARSGDIEDWAPDARGDAEATLALILGDERELWFEAVELE